MKIVVVSALLCLFFKDAELKTFNPSSSSELQSAIDEASAGDVIQLEVKDYEGDFTMTNSGSNGNPIRIIGKSEKDKNTRIIGSSTAFSVQGNYWMLQSLSIKGGNYAVEIQGGHNTLQALSIQGVKKGVSVKGSANSIRDCSIASGGLAVSIESGDGNQIRSTSITTSNPNLSIFEKTCCGSIESCTFEGPVVIKGNQYIISSSTANRGVNIEGCNNELSSNVFKNVYFTKTCKNNDVGMNVYSGVSDQAHSFDMEKVGSYNGASGKELAFSLAVITNAIVFIYSSTH